MKTDPKLIKILGIDPGLETVGYGLIETDGRTHHHLDGGIITTSNQAEMGQRLLSLHRDLSKLIRQSQPDIVGMEKLFFFKNITSGIKVSQAQGVLMLACVQHKLEIVEYTPLAVKMAITQYGRATKAQIKTEVQALLKLPDKIKNDNHADGLAVALTHAIKTATNA